MNATLSPKSTIVPAILALVFALPGCPPTDDDGLVDLETERVCDDGVPAYDVTLERYHSEIGPTGNDLAVDGQALWIVESEANTVSRFDLAERRLDAGYIDVGSNRNPYSVAVDGDADIAWITNFLADTVTVADTDDGKILDELDGDFASPSAVALTETHAYVTNVDFRGSAEGYGPGTLTVVDRTTREVVSTVETAFQNPQHVAVESLDGDEHLFVSGTGTLSGTESPRVESEGGLEQFDIGDDPVEPPSQTFALGQRQVETVGAPGRPNATPDGDRLYVASAIAPVLFVFDLAEQTWAHDATDPLWLYEADGDTTHRAAMGPDGLLWVTAFNDDELHLIDTACDEPIADPIDVGEVADRLEGPQAVTAFERTDRIEGYYLLGIANALGRLQLTPSGD